MTTGSFKVQARGQREEHLARGMNICSTQLVTPKESGFTDSVTPLRTFSISNSCELNSLVPERLHFSINN